MNYKVNRTGSRLFRADRWRRPHGAALLYAVLCALAAGSLPAASHAQYVQRNIVSDIPGMAELQDDNLRNPWGSARSGASALWVSNRGSNTATLYNINGTTGAASINPLVVHTPGPTTGMISNTAGFNLPTGGAARFLFSGSDGNLYGWNPAQGTQAAAAHIGDAHPYTGLASGTAGTNSFLYAASLTEGKVQVFNSDFSPVSLSGSFTDPNLPAGYTPFNVHNVGGQLYVTYLRQGAPGGIVNIFDTDGNFVRRFATDGTLLNPWGIAQAPDDFGTFSDALLIGNFNFGDSANGAGYINAVDPNTGEFLGLLEDPSGHPVQVDGLWEILFGNGTNGGVANQLYFTAGIQGERHGLLGSLQAVPEPGAWAMLSGIGAAGLLLRRRWRA